MADWREQIRKDPRLKRLKRQLQFRKRLLEQDEIYIVETERVTRALEKAYKQNPKAVRSFFRQFSYPTPFQLLADGGLWANNPALVAVVDAKRRFGQRLENLRILSIGAGSGKSYYSQNEKLWKRWLGWGFLTKWGRGKFIDMLLNLQAETANNMLGLLLANDQILRINYASDRKLTIADTGEMENLISKADSDFTRAATKIGEFFLPSPTASS